MRHLVPKKGINTHIGPADLISNQLIKINRTNWNGEDYKQVMISFFTALEDIQKNITD